MNLNKIKKEKISVISTYIDAKRQLGRIKDFLTIRVKLLKLKRAFTVFSGILNFNCFVRTNI